MTLLILLPTLIGTLIVIIALRCVWRLCRRILLEDDGETNKKVVALFFWIIILVVTAVMVTQGILLVFHESLEIWNNFYEAF